jgi:hypothetical protein
MTNKTVSFFPKLENLLPPVPASSILPEWYKNQSGYDDFGNPTIKRCLPIFDAMSFGYFLVSQSNITVDSTNPGGLIVTSDNDFNGELFNQHDLQQYDKYPIPSGYHNHVLRIHPMWSVQTPKDYSALFINPINNGSKNINAITGLIDTDNFISDGHLSFFVKENTVFKIKSGTPIVQVMPIKRENWDSKEMSTEESSLAISSQDNTGIMVNGEHQSGAYKKIFHVQKSFK